MEFRIKVTNLDEVEAFYGDRTIRFDADHTDRWEKFTNTITLPVNPDEIGRIIYEECGGSSVNGYFFEVDSPLTEIGLYYDSIYATNLKINDVCEVIYVNVDEISDEQADIINALMSEGYELDEALDVMDDVEVLDCGDEEDFGRMYAEDNYSYDYELEEYIEFERLGEDRLGRYDFYTFYENMLYIIR